MASHAPSLRCPSLKCAPDVPFKTIGHFHNDVSSSEIHSGTSFALI